ncbi:hypothetical protein [Fuerstiella marisgermanici]|uniref:HAMP domain-containing protein n=1 Tax=Fuerstiella marisgermanici TaxID=1891926 RepID=A0A1P8WBB4_9PLAN|nr:hypothetical protein [Fuerstiella marisgermanici]APZ91341.1 hypothetical protein Fuma_00929 [Fuerstiella marisgermanici]
MTKQKNHRKKSVVNVRVQWTLALRVVLHFLVFVCAGAVFGLINQFLIDPFGGLAGNLSAFCRNSGPILVALLCLLPIFIRDTLTLSNRIAGPIYSLEKTIVQISDGDEDVRPLKFRKDDMWEELPEMFNNMVESLRSSGDSAAETSSVTQDQRELVEV